MKYSTRSQIILLCLLVNIFIFLLLFLSQPGTSDQNKPGRPKFSGEKVTVVIIEFEEFENDIPDTVDSILKSLPGVKILIVSKKLPYPPVDIYHDNVKIVVRDQASSNPRKWGDPSFYIKTEYVLLIPDAVRLHNVEKLENFNYGELNNADGTRIAVFPVDSNYQCSKLKVDYRQWTLSYQDKTYDGVCDAISGSSKVVLLFQSSYLANLSEPFLRPYPAGLFIQFASRGWKSTVHDNDVFTPGKKLFTDPHKRWKADQRKNERLLRMYKRFQFTAYY